MIEDRIPSRQDIQNELLRLGISTERAIQKVKAALLSVSVRPWEHEERADYDHETIRQEFRRRLYGAQADNNEERQES